MALSALITGGVSAAVRADNIGALLIGAGGGFLMLGLDYVSFRLRLARWYRQRGQL